MNNYTNDNDKGDDTNKNNTKCNVLKLLISKKLNHFIVIELKLMLLMIIDKQSKNDGIKMIATTIIAVAVTVVNI